MGGPGLFRVTGLRLRAELPAGSGIFCWESSGTPGDSIPPAGIRDPLYPGVPGDAPGEDVAVGREDPR
jgi:hypothetical protein